MDEQDKLVFVLLLLMMTCGLLGGYGIAVS